MGRERGRGKTVDSEIQEGAVVARRAGPVINVASVVGVIAFHEKAGRSQVGWVVFLLDIGFSRAEVATVATLPSALSKSDGCSLGASWVFSFQPVLPPVSRPFVHSEE